MTADPTEIRRALALFVEPGAVVELRIPDAGRDGVVSGYFDDPDACIRAAVEWNGKAPGVYFTPNPIPSALLARARNRVRTRAKSTTSDRDVLGRHWLLIDLDPRRPAGISATQVEHDAALLVAQGVRAELQRAGWPDPVFADSGNGAHLLYRIDLPNDAASTALVERCLTALDFRFGDAVVGVDLTTFNAARIWKLYGTVAAKGDAAADRPHRLARLLDVPAPLVPVSGPQLETLAALAPSPADPRPGSRGDFNIERWLTDHADRLHMVAAGPWQGGRKWVLNPCPWDPAHTNRAAYIVQHASGALAAGCHHNGCAGKDWAALRALVEPAWREGPRPRDGGPSDDPRPRIVANPPDATNPWLAAMPAPDFLQEAEIQGDFLEPHQLARGSITEWFSPRGIGKTLIAHALAAKQARAGRRVLLIDRDNSRREVKRRLRAWGVEDCPTLKVLTRDDAPPLTDRAAWARFPLTDYDIILIDSLDASSEGVGEQDSAKPSRAIASILDVAHAAAGPAILALGNTTKSGQHGRGSGVIEDRADVVYEVRDATGFQPTGTQPWWLELPGGGRADWGASAARRQRRETYRLAFVPTKFRLGEAPDPSIVELDLRASPWQYREVTAEVEAEGQAARATAAAERQARMDEAATALQRELARRRVSGQPDLGKKSAEAFLRAHGLTQKAARQVLRDGAAGTATARAARRWHLAPDDVDGRKINVRLPEEESDATAFHDLTSTPPERHADPVDAVAQSQSGPPHSTVPFSASTAEIEKTEMRLPPAALPRVPGQPDVMATNPPAGDIDRDGAPNNGTDWDSV